MRIKRSIICELCGTPFHPWNGQRNPQFCSRTCSNKSRARPMADRFYERLDRSGGPDACWPYQGSRNPQGYGTFFVRERGQKIKATHVAWFLEHGEWPKQNMLHTCDNPPCCNPRHLFDGSYADNNADTARKGRTRRGSKHPNSKLTEDAVRAIRSRFENGELCETIAADFGISHGHVYDIGKRRKWGHLP